MSLIVKETGGKMIPVIPGDTYMGICYSIIHIGTVKDTYMGEEKLVNKVRLAWEIPGETYVFDEQKGPEPRVLGKDYTLSLGDRSNLRKDLSAWRGRDFTADELKGFDLFNVIGHSCFLSVSVKTSKTSQREYNQIASISKLPKAMSGNVPELHAEMLKSNYDSKSEDFFAKVWDKIPNWIQDEIKGSEEYNACVTAAEKGKYDKELAKLVLATASSETSDDAAGEEQAALAPATAKPAAAKPAAAAQPVEESNDEEPPF